ncbi:MAG: hypothetical protein GY745_22290 [Actinomycetia bacterium]|nr:hypothetical protein [Actinomycetes bacterium]MCP4087750.1 hypothetical protein [Actinomycetes bacterium]
MAEDLDALVRRMAEIADELVGLADHEFERSYALRQEQDELRSRAEVFKERKDSSRTTEALEAELEVRRSQLQALEKQELDLVSMAGGSGGGGGMSASGAEFGPINEAILSAAGAGEVQARIAEISRELERRGSQTTDHAPPDQAADD